MSPVHLRRIDAERNTRRFHELDLQPDLFGHWAFIGERGRFGSSGQVMTLLFPTQQHLIRDLTPTGVDQIWVSGITYLRLAEDFVYLAVVIDAFSRKRRGWRSRRSTGRSKRATRRPKA